MGKGLKGESERNADVFFEFLVVGPILSCGLDMCVCDHLLLFQNVFKIVLIQLSDIRTSGVKLYITN